MVDSATGLTPETLAELRELLARERKGANTSPEFVNALFIVARPAARAFLADHAWLPYLGFLEAQGRLEYPSSPDTRLPAPPHRLQELRRRSLQMIERSLGHWPLMADLDERQDRLGRPAISTELAVILSQDIAACRLPIPRPIPDAPFIRPHMVSPRSNHRLRKFM